MDNVSTHVDQDFMLMLHLRNVFHAQLNIAVNVAQLILVTPVNQDMSYMITNVSYPAQVDTMH
jgi:hypothetical protein